MGRWTGRAGIRRQTGGGGVYGAEQTADRDKKEQRNIRAGSNCKSIWGELIWGRGKKQRQRQSQQKPATGLGREKAAHGGQGERESDRRVPEGGLAQAPVGALETTGRS